jgi:hypothetical protein
MNEHLKQQGTKERKSHQETARNHPNAVDPLTFKFQAAGWLVVRRLSAGLKTSPEQGA